MGSSWLLQLATAMATAAGALPAASPGDDRTTLLLFADDSLLASIDPRLERRNNAPQKGPRVLQPTEPWESYAVFAYNSVVHVGPGEYRLYYDCVDAKIESDGKQYIGREFVCLATSADGVAWIKPKLNLFSYTPETGGALSSANNILLAAAAEGEYVIKCRYTHLNVPGNSCINRMHLCRARLNIEIVTP